MRVKEANTCVIERVGATLRQRVSGCRPNVHPAIYLPAIRALGFAVAVAGRRDASVRLFRAQAGRPHRWKRWSVGTNACTGLDS